MVRGASGRITPLSVVETVRTLLRLMTFYRAPESALVFRRKFNSFFNICFFLMAASPLHPYPNRLITSKRLLFPFLFAIIVSGLGRTGNCFAHPFLTNDRLDSQCNRTRVGPQAKQLRTACTLSEFLIYLRYGTVRKLLRRFRRHLVATKL